MYYYSQQTLANLHIKHLLISVYNTRFSYHTKQSLYSCIISTFHNKVLKHKRRCFKSIQNKCLKCLSVCLMCDCYYIASKGETSADYDKLVSKPFRFKISQLSVIITLKMFVMCGHQWYYYNSLSIYLDPNGTPTAIATSLGCNLNVCTLGSSYTTPGKYKCSPKIQYQQESEMGITATV